jgi:membrane protein implicated in regulation of membrane protease activity
MQAHGWSRSTLIRYALLQLPGIGLAGCVVWILHVLFGLSLMLCWIGMGLWVLKDVVLFFFVWPAYQSGQEDGPHTLIGLHGVSREALHPEGYIRLYGVLWRAKSVGGVPIPPATRVLVVARQGLTLIVRPLARDYQKQ